MMEPFADDERQMNFDGMVEFIEKMMEQKRFNLSRLFRKFKAHKMVRKYLFSLHKSMNRVQAQNKLTK